MPLDTAKKVWPNCYFSLHYHTGQEIPEILSLQTLQQKISQLFFCCYFLTSKSPTNSPPASFFQEIPFCAFLSRENSLCSALSHTTELQWGRFSDSRGHYRHQPTAIQQALRSEASSSLCWQPPNTHTGRECQQQCLTPGQTKGFSVHHTLPARAPRPQRSPCAPGKAKAATATTGLSHGFTFHLVSSSCSSLVLLALASPSKPGFFPQ